MNSQEHFGLSAYRKVRRVFIDFDGVIVPETRLTRAEQKKPRVFFLELSFTPWLQPGGQGLLKIKETVSTVFSGRPIKLLRRENR